MAKIYHEDHNKVKIKSLLFLRLRSEVGNIGTIARDIATAIGGNVDSLYVLLGNWSNPKWGLVNRLDGGKPMSYTIGRPGHKFLGNLHKWYTGNVDALLLDIAVKAGMVIWWPKKQLNGNVTESFYYIQAPFKSEKDFIEIEFPKDTNWYFTGKPLLQLKVKSGYEALTNIDNFGLCWQKDMVQAMVDKGIVSWKE